MKQLKDHTSEDTAYYCADYPYGRVIRCVIRFWIETNKRGQQRFVRQTTQRSFNHRYNHDLETYEKSLQEKPKPIHKVYFDEAKTTKEWNKPKKSVYFAKVVLFLNPENNHVEFDALAAYISEDKVEEFNKKWEL